MQYYLEYSGGFMNYVPIILRKIFLILLSFICISNPLCTIQIKAYNNVFSSRTLSCVAAAAVGIGILSYKAFKHTWQLDAYNLVERAVRNNREKDFLFGVYLQDIPEFKYPITIFNNKHQLQCVINQDIRLSDKVYIYNTEGKRIAPNYVTKTQIREALAREQEKLECTMRSVAWYTDAPQKILHWYDTHVGEIISRGSFTDKEDLWPIDRCINLIKNDVEAGSKQFVYDRDFVKHIYQALELSWPEYIKKEVWFTPFYRPITWVTGKLSCTWAVGTRYNKATKIFAELMRVYSRLLTIKSIVDSKDFRLDEGAREKTKYTTIDDAKELVQTLHKTVSDSDLHERKTAWIGTFWKLKNVIDELKDRYQVNVKIIHDQMLLIETAIYDREKNLTEPDIVVCIQAYLDNITRALDTRKDDI